MPTLILIRGLPGSGKSTLARKLAQERGLVHVEADMFFVRGGKYRFKPHDLPRAHAWCERQARQHLEAGTSVVVSNTFTRRWEMQPYFDMAAELGVPVEVIVATGTFKNVHGVPEYAIQRMRERWED
jgi:predicted kinase